MLITEAYEELFEILDGKHIELHIDVNSKEGEGSNIVYNAAVGYIKGMTGLDPKTKPDAWAASCCADHYCKIIH